MRLVDGVYPGADGGWGELAQLLVAEVGSDQVVDDVAVACRGCGAESDSSGVPFSEPVGEAGFSGLGVGVMAGVEVGFDGA